MPFFSSNALKSSQIGHEKMLCGNLLIAFQTVEKDQQKLGFLLYMYQSEDGSMIGLPIVCFHTSDIAWFNSNHWNLHLFD